MNTMRRDFLFGIISTLSLSCAMTAQAAEPRSCYHGKTINLIVSTSPGVATDVAGQLASRNLGKYIPGHPDILDKTWPAPAASSLPPSS
jgi:tripartite-type tricarboxylate transporter receptor subunit TctC